MSAPMAMPIKPPLRPRRRWWLHVLAVLAVLILIPFGWYAWSRFAMQSAWDAAVAEAEADLPRWRLLEMEADRPKIPQEENSGLHIIAAINRHGRFSINGAANYELIFAKLPPNAQLNHQQVQFIRAEFAKHGKVREFVRQLKDKPRGRFAITYSDDGFGTLIPDHHKPRAMADWLEHDAYLLAQDRKTDDAVESCLAMINAGRTMEGELTLIALLVRVSVQSRAFETLERVLAQEPPASEKTLAKMQRQLEKEILTDYWLAAARGERAMNYHFFENLRSGKLSGRGMFNPIGNTETWNEKMLNAFPSLMLPQYPECLRFMNRGVEISKLPIEERHAKFSEWESEAMKSSNILIKRLLPAIPRVHKAECRSQIMLRATVAVLACERYRLKHDAWPATLDVLVKEKLLAAVPADPMDGQPLRYRPTKDGIVIYSIAFDGQDNQGNINREKPYDAGVDLGFRLWNRNRRSLAPLPPVAEPEVN